MAKQKKKRSHEFVIRVTFDKPCTARHAIQEIRDTIHGEFYPTVYLPTDPGEFRVKAIKHIPKEKAIG